MISHNQLTRHYGFLLLPGFSPLAHASAMEPLLACNRITGEDRYRISLLGFEPGDIGAGAQSAMRVPVTLPQPQTLDALILCGTTPALHSQKDAWLDQLKSWSRDIPQLGGVASGGYLLAEAGLLRGCRAAVHWWSLAQLRSAFPDVLFTTDAFALDRNRFTCRGGTAALDMMLMLIGRDQGPELAEALSQYFVRERLGANEIPERVRPDARLREEQPGLVDAVALMEANIEEPLSTDDLALHTGMSRRQLERLFRKYFNEVPSRYYMSIRLEHSRRLLRETRRSVADIALGCGFSSSAHFSTAYRNAYGLTPSEERALGD